MKKSLMGHTGYDRIMPHVQNFFWEAEKILPLIKVFLPPPLKWNLPLIKKFLDLPLITLAYDYKCREEITIFYIKRSEVQFLNI